MKKKVLRKLGKMSRLTIATLFLVCLCSNLMHASEKVEAQTLHDVQIQINANNANLTELFELVENQTEFRFVYPASLKGDVQASFDFNYNSISVADLLTEIGAQTGLWFRQMNSTIAVNTENVWTSEEENEIIPPGEEQFVEITGQVTDAQTGEVLPGVNIIVLNSEEAEGRTIGTQTDLNGNYSISVPEELNTLVFSYIGYQRLEVGIEGRTEINVQLSPDVQMLDDLVVVGYTEQSREDLVASVATISSEKIDRSSSTNSINGLQGKLAGVSIPVSSGQPGETPNIIIRGGTSLDGGGNPLVLIDGVERSFDNVNPKDIQSIQVLKDAASTAAYGARAANGVIVITTKQGRIDQKPVVTIGYQMGVDVQSRKYDYLNAKDYLVLARNVWARGKDPVDVNTKLYQDGNSATVPTYTQKGQFGNSLYTPAYIDNIIAVEGQSYVDNLLNNGWQTVDDPVNSGKTIIFYDNNYQDIVWDNALSQNYNASVSGGSDQSTYYLSMGYNENGGTFIGTDYRRFTGTANIGYDVSDIFNVSSHLSYVWNDNKYVDNDIQTLVRGTRITPLHRIFNDQGEPMAGEYGSVPYRPHQLEYNHRDNSTEKISMRVEGILEIIDGLTFESSVSLFMEDYSNRFFSEYYDMASTIREKYQISDRDRRLMTDQILKFDKTLEQNHNLTLLVGANYTRYNRLDFSGEGERSLTDYIETFTGDPNSSIVNGRVVPNFDINSESQQEKTISLFSQFNYNYDQRYILSGSIRRDGFSNFAPNNKFAIFPAVAAGWNISNENFWKSSLINQLKIRASYGQTGLSPLSYRDTYGGYGSNTYASIGGILRTSLPNPNLVWETTRIADIGADLGFFQGRLNLNFDFYRKVTNDRLSSLPMPSESGFRSIKYNVGKMENKGIEVTLGATILESNSFSWESNFTFAYNKPKVLELPDNGRDKNRIGGGTIYDPELGKEVEVGGYAEGERPGGMWAFHADGVFASDEEARASTVQDLTVSAAALGLPKNGGDVRWSDLNHDGIIDSRDVVFMGYRIPDKIGGIQNTIVYKNLSLLIDLDYTLGHVISNGALARSMGSARAGNEGAVTFATRDDVWQEEGQIDAKYPRFSFGDTDFGYANHLRHVRNGIGTGHKYGTDNSLYFSDGDFLAIREISVSYNLPTSLMEKLGGLNGVELNASIYNVGYITKYGGLNPEVYTGYDTGGYPRPRQFTLGVNVKL